MACGRGWVRSQEALKQKSGHVSPGVPKTRDRRHCPKKRQAWPWYGGEQSLLQSASWVPRAQSLAGGPLP